jgi:hypothetical protein
MDPADEMAAKIEPTEHQSAGAVAGSIDKLDEQLRVSVEALLHPSPPRKLVEELDDLLLAINHHLDQETSQRKAIYYRLAAIESEMKGRSEGSPVIWSPFALVLRRSWLGNLTARQQSR